MVIARVALGDQLWEVGMLVLGFMSGFVTAYFIWGWPFK